MYSIPAITAQPTQQLTVILPDGSQMVMTMYFVPLQYGWFITNLTWNDFTLNSLRITTSPNMLNQWRNLLTFGLGCFTLDQQEPTQQQDFSSGYAALYILDSSEIVEYAEALANG